MYPSPAPNGMFNGLEERLDNKMFAPQRERSFTDKSLAKEEIGKIAVLVRKRDLTSEDWNELLYLLAGVESKVLNFDENDRYILGKDFAWIRDLVDLEIKLVDYHQHLIEKNYNISPNSLKLLKSMIDKHGDNCKFLIDVFFFMGRTTLSLEGAAFKTINTNKYEYVYDQPMINQSPQAANKKFFGLI